MKKIVFFAVSLLVTCLSMNAQLTTQVSKTRKAIQRPSAPQVKMEKFEKVEKSTSAKFNPNLIPVKKVLSSRKLKGGQELRIVRLENGMVKKQFLNAGKKLQRKITTTGKVSGNAGQSVTAASDSLNEGFEGWDNETWDWLPEGWTDTSKVDSVSFIEDIYGYTFNFTWATSAFNPKSGQYSARVQFAYPVDTPGEDGELDTLQYNPPIPQDEWLISPPVTVEQADYVFAFDLYYDPSWARLNYELDENDSITEVNFDAMHTVVEALISTDGGNTWTKKWDNREDAAQYTDEELLDILLVTGAPWIRVSIDLAEYHKQDIQIAIRYWDDGGESVSVDNVTVGYLIPEVSYRRPSGYLISGLSTEYYALDGNLIVGHAYTPTQWAGNVENCESLGWSFSDTYGNPLQASTDENPVVTLPYGLYNTPLLSATGRGNRQAEFQLGKSDGVESQMGLGGQNIWTFTDGEFTFGLGNYDLQYGLVTYSDVNAEDLTSDGWTFRGIANYFEKPASKYMFDTFYVHPGNIVAKPGEPVKLNIYAVDDSGNVGEIIASSETYPEDFIHVFSSDDGLFDYYTIPFKFMSTDPETGRESEGYVEIDDHFVAEFYNYQSADIIFQREDHPTGELYAYVSFEEGQFFSLGATSALFDMNAAFPFLHTADNRYEAPDAGGTKTFEIDAYWNPNGWWAEEDLPDWISVGELTANPETGVVTFPVTVSALPQGVSGRSANIYIASYACNLTLQIKQGDAEWQEEGRPTSISTVNVKEVKAVRRGNDFLLSYPSSATSVSVYNVAGQKTGEYKLNQSGQQTLPAANWAKGIYILRFTGSDSAVKVLK
jgi:hypothetical protein